MNVCRMKKTKSDGYRRDGELHRVSGFTYEDNYVYNTTLRKALAPILDKAAKYKKSSLIMAGGRVSNLPLLSKKCSWSLGGFMEELGGFEKGKRLVIGVYIPNDVSWLTGVKYFISHLHVYISPIQKESLSDHSENDNMPSPCTNESRGCIK